MTAFRLMQGDFLDDFIEDYDYDAERILFTLSCLVLPIILLNLLIAIMGQAYTEVEGSSKEADVREQLEIVQEVGKFICWENKNNWCWIHWISSSCKTEDILEKEEISVEEKRKSKKKNQKQLYKKFNAPLKD